MPRPRRLYQQDGNYYYLIGGKPKKIKVPEGMTQKQLQKVNIKNIITIGERRRVKRRKKKVDVRFGKRIVPQMEAEVQPGLSTYLFKPKLAVKTLEELAQSSNDTVVERLASELVKKLTPVITPTTIPSAAQVPALPPVIPPAPIEPTPPVNRPSTDADAGAATYEDGNLPQEDPSVSNINPLRAPALMNKPVTALSKPPTTISKGVPAPDPLGISPAKGTPGVRTSGAPEFTNLNNSPGSDAPSSTSRSSSTSSKMALTAGQQDSIVRAMGNSDDVSAFKTQMRKLLGVQYSNYKTYQDATISKMIADRRSKMVTRGSGYAGEDGLYNTELEKLAKKRIKNYVPVIASDEISSLPRYVKPGDKRFAFIINTNPSTSDGSGLDNHRPGHWRSVYISNEDDFPSVEYFDPLCEGRIPNDLLKVCMKIARKMNPEMMFKYKQNMLRRQSKLSSSCGYHSIKFIDDRFHGVPWSTATGYDEYMSRLNEAKDDSKNGEKDVMKYIKKYESYI